MEIRKLKYYKYRYPKQIKARRNKYGNKSCHCLADHWHASIKEADYCNQLYMMKKNGDIKDYEKEKDFDLCVNGIRICKIRPDFMVWDKDGTLSVHEVKSYPTMTPIWNLKRKLFEAVFPEIPYIVIK